MKHTVYETPSIGSSDILKIIDDAMEKKDREVWIFISGIGTTVKVRPLEDSKPMWIRLKNCDAYICPECHRPSTKASLYCSDCGEMLHGVKPEGER